MATAFAAAALLTLVVLVPKTGADYIPWRNERFEDETAVLNETAVDTDYDATYAYVFDDDGDAATNDDDINVTDGGVTAASFPADMRIVGIDLTDVGNPLSEVTDYSDDPAGNTIVVQFPDTSEILFDNSVVQFCLAFAIERGVTTTDITADDDLVEDYHVEFGAGDAVIWSGSFAGDEDDGAADSKEEGECLGAKDTADSKVEFGGKLEMIQIMGILNKAYVLEDAEEPAEFYVKIVGARAEDMSANATETGDLVDFGVQFYTWEEGAVEYASVATAYNWIGVVSLIVAGVISILINPSKSDLAAGIHKKRGGA